MILTFDQIHKYFENRLKRSLNTHNKISVRCPFHDDKNASATVFLSGNGGFNCQGCSAKGNIFQFEMLYSKCSMSEAKQKISEITGAKLDRYGSKGPCTAVYDYRDSNNLVVFQKRRYEPPDDKKTFSIYHPSDSGAWAPGIEEGKKKVLYNLPELITCNLAMITEGEKDCDTLSSIGLFKDHPEYRIAATTNSEGAWQPGHAAKWLPDYNPFFTGKHIFIFEDNDESGRTWADYVARQVYPFAESVRRISFPDLPEKGDVTDWMENHTVEQLEKRLTTIPRWEIPKIEIPPMSQDAVDFATEDVKPVEWLIQNIIPIAGNGIICGDPKASKAQPIDCRVLTPSGWRTMGDIQVGDLVMGSAGTPIKVLATYPQGVKSCYRVHVSDGTSTEATSDHLWKTESHNNRQRGQFGKIVSTLTLAEMIKNPEKRDTHIPIVKPIQYSQKEHPILPYSMGVILGDGCIAQRNVSITQIDGDDMINRLKEECPQSYSFNKLVRRGVYAYRSTSESASDRVAFWRILEQWGLEKKKSADKFIPEVYLRGSIHQRMDLLRGLLDTDGCIHINKKGHAKITFSTVSPKLASGFVEIIQSLGGVAISTRRKSRYKKNGKFFPCQDYYLISVNIPRGLGCPFILKRKSIIWEKSTHGLKKVPSRTVIDVEYSREAEAKCITVDSSDGLYITENHIVTHNSYHAMDIAISLACGEDWLNNMVVRRVKTYLVSREDAPGITQRRIGKMLRGNPSYQRNLEGWMRVNTRRHTADFKVTNKEHMDRLVEEINKFNSELCILDVFRSVHESEENDNDAMPEVLSKVNRIQNECNCAVMLVHHLNKSTPENIFKGLRGASAIHGWMEWGIGISVTNPEEPDKHQWVRKLEFENKEGVCSPIYSRISGRDPEVIKIELVDIHTKNPVTTRPTISKKNKPFIESLPYRDSQGDE